MFASPLIDFERFKLTGPDFKQYIVNQTLSPQPIKTQAPLASHLEGYETLLKIP